MVRPRFVKEIKAFDQTVEVFDTEVINPQICSKETISTLQKDLAELSSESDITSDQYHRMIEFYRNYLNECGCRLD